MTTMTSPTGMITREIALSARRRGLTGRLSGRSIGATSSCDTVTMSSESDDRPTGEDSAPDHADISEAGIPRRLSEAMAERGVTRARAAITELGDLDEAVYRAVAMTPTKNLDNELRVLSTWADNSKLWFGIAGAAALFGGHRGRAAALDGVIAIGITSFVVNQPLKRLLPRNRPDRDTIVLERNRHVKLPTSPSFPSGHSASAFAFANALSGELPWLALPVRGMAAAVGWSRIHTGVHYPGDVIAGAIIGGAVGQAVGTVRRGILTRRARKR